MASDSMGREDYQKIYDDTNYFIDAIISDYDFYGNFINSLKTGSAQFKINRRTIKKTIDESWIKTIEDCMVSLDTVVRKPTKYIEQSEEVLPIELSRNITSKSLQHLAQHTDYINNIDENGVITPSKILNVFNDETMLTYENKFINTLILKLYIFVNRRYMELKEKGDSSESTVMDFSSEFEFSGSHGKINMNMEIASKENPGGTVSISERLSKLNSVATMYLNSEFAKTMGKNYIRPPIMHTNAINKNKDLRQCLNLWQFIESYSKIGYEIETQESAEKPDDEYINELYSTLALQYMMFKFKVSSDFEDSTTVLEKSKAQKPLSPIFKSKLRDIETEEYNVYDTEYRRVVPVSTLSNRKLSDSELQVRLAVELALDADKFIAESKLAAEKKRLKEEEQKLAEKRKREKERTDAILRDKKRLDRIRKKH